MAEKAVSQDAVALTLTYRNNADGTLPQSAITFDVTDIQNFLKRLRKAGERDGASFRYMVAGERGAKRDRVHWHMLLFVKRGTVSRYGEWRTEFGNQPCSMAYDQRLIWSMWPHGTVFPQVPDQDGCAYVIKYALKDYYRESKSRGTGRHSKSEQHAAGQFMMSKQPAIGMEWLHSRLEDWEERGVLPASLKLKVPDTRGYYYPRKRMREAFLYGLHRVRTRIEERTGKAAAQWSALQASVERPTPAQIAVGDWDDPAFKDWRILVHGKEERASAFSEDDERRKIQGKAEEQARRAQGIETLFRCGGPRPCFQCRWGDDWQQFYQHFKTQYANRDAKFSRLTLSEWYRATQPLRCNPWCQRKDEKLHAQLFRARVVKPLKGIDEFNTFVGDAQKE